jgi:hypothetical protein
MQGHGLGSSLVLLSRQPQISLHISFEKTEMRERIFSGWLMRRVRRAEHGRACRFLTSWLAAARREMPIIAISPIGCISSQWEIKGLQVSKFSPARPCQEANVLPSSAGKVKGWF